MPAAGLVAGLVAAVVLTASGIEPWWAVPVVPAAVAAAVDARSRRLPDRWVVATAATTGVALARTSPPVAVAGLALAVGVGAALLVVHLLSPAALGFGDVKFGAAVAPLVAGSTGGTIGSLFVAVVWLCAASGSALAAGLVRRRHDVAFGPSLLLALAAVLTVVQLTTISQGGGGG